MKQACQYQHFADIFDKNISNSYHETGPFLYSLKFIRKLEVSWCLQGAQKETSGMKWVKSHLIFTYFLYIKVTDDSLYNWKTSYKMKLLIFLI